MKLRLRAATQSTPEGEHGVTLDLGMTPAEMRSLGEQFIAHAAKTDGPNALAFPCGLATVHFVREEESKVQVAATIPSTLVAPNRVGRGR